MSPRNEPIGYLLAAGNVPLTSLPRRCPALFRPTFVKRIRPAISNPLVRRYRGNLRIFVYKRDS
jgi:hypothetical protein